MRLKITTSKNAASLYVIKSIYNSKTQSNSSKIIEKLGTEKELREKLNGRDPYEWAKEYIQKLNALEKEETRKVLVPFAQSKQIVKDKQHSFNGGYLFLQQIYYMLGLHRICQDITKRYKFTFDLNTVLSRLIYGRVIFPTSKLGTWQLSKRFLEQPELKLQHIYRSLEILAKETDSIQSKLYKNSSSISPRNDQILYYDCTNYFFEIEQEDGLKQYGYSKEHRPNPIVQMGLFMDGDGIPLAFSINSGNTNEQTTLKPLEEKIIHDFPLAKFIVCTDAGLSSTQNRKLNNKHNRAFITTQSLKKLKSFLTEWALDPTGWSIEGSSLQYDLRQIESTDEIAASYRDKVFYKERWIKENDLEQKFIVTFSLKYKYYQQQLRSRQIERARTLIDLHPASLKKHHSNDCKRFITKTAVTACGEIADKDVYSLDEEAIANEARYDGFYAVCTNLDDAAAKIARINHRRWEIEECFRLMKTDFKARPVYLSRDDRIKAHFITCFLALVLYRYLEKKLSYKYTAADIIRTLRTMDFYAVPGEGYIPTYTRTDITDALHEAFNFHTDYEIVSKAQMKNIFKMTKR